MMIIGRDKTVRKTYMLETLLKMFERNELNKNHPLQRRADQWTKDSQSGLVATVIKHEDIDSIKVCEQVNDNMVTLWLIDAMQRITTLHKYKHNLFPIGKAIKFPIIQYIDSTPEGNKVVEYDLRGKYYKDLPAKLKENFDNYEMEMVKHLDCTDEEISYHISRYNDQKSMNVSQKGILSMPNFAPSIKRIANRPFFMDNFYSETEKKNGCVERIVTDAIAIIYHLDNLKRGKRMNEYIEENATVEQFEELELEIARLEKVVTGDEFQKGIFNSKNSFIFLKVFHDFIKLGLDDERFADFLREFKSNYQENKHFEEYDNETFASYDSGNRNTKDKKVIVAKTDMITQMMEEFFADEIEEKTEENVTESSTLEFLHANVSEDITKEDVSFYEECLDDYLVVVNEKSKLLEPQNIKSLIGICAYSFQKEEDLEPWLEDFATRNDNYLLDQKENYELMKKDFDDFTKGE